MSLLSGTFYAAILQHFILDRKIEGILFFVSTIVIIIGIVIFSIYEPFYPETNDSGISDSLHQLNDSTLKNSIDNPNLT